MSAQASQPAAAGVHRAAEAVDGYYENPRPELVELVPAHARVVVDVGCGQGALGGAVRRERGAWVLGLELVPEALEVARGRLDRVERVDLDAVEELPVAIGSVDAFLCGDVLEHLRDPERLLGVLRRYLAPGGVVIA
jgi:O-antigen biosynthesis protein